MRSLVIIPTYNEAENISITLKGVLLHGNTDVLVVDDHSPDGTASQVKSQEGYPSRIHLMERSKKNGLAGAYLAAFQWGIERGYDFLVQMDADLSHDPIEIGKFLKLLSTENADVIVGCRYMPGGSTPGWSKLRRWISRGGNLYARLLLGLPFRDLTGGFNAWKKEVLQNIRLDTIRSQGYAFQVELKHRAHVGGFRIQEMPIRFTERRFGRSKMSGHIVWEGAYRVLQLRWASHVGT